MKKNFIIALPFTDDSTDWWKLTEEDVDILKRMAKTEGQALKVFITGQLKWVIQNGKK